MNQPHKHKDVIIAWANGAQIQFQSSLMKESNEWEDIRTPTWATNIEYRIKPEPKESVHTFRIGVAACDDGGFYTFTADNEAEARYLQDERNFIGWISDWEPFLLTKVEK